jgi:AAA ATPase-like protein
LIEPAPFTDDRPPTLRRVWLRNFKSFEDFTVELGRFNVLVGANNSGKSTLLQGIDLLYTLLKLPDMPFSSRTPPDGAVEEGAT